MATFTIGKPEIFLDETAWLTEWDRRVAEKRKRRLCRRCLYDETVPGIRFNPDGVCSYCEQHDLLDRQYPCGEPGWAIVKEKAAEIRNACRRRPYDVIVGVSGGCDSSFLVHLAKSELGLRPLAVHFDNTWDNQIAVENIHNVLKGLGVELWTYVVNNEEYDDLYRSFLLAGVPDWDIPTDIGLAAVLNRACEKFGVHYTFEGHSFRTEGVSPLGWTYMDSKYIDSVQRRYGTRRLKTFPHLWLSTQIRWMLFNKIQKIRPLWHINHRKEETKALLARNYGWQWYGGHHLENRLAVFGHLYFLPRRLGIDQRANGFSALIRSGQMSQEEGLRLVYEPPRCDPEVVSMIKKRLGLSDAEFVEAMTQPIHTYREFRTYKRTFERLRPFFYVMARLNRIPMSFYLKYTAPSRD